MVEYPVRIRLRDAPEETFEVKFEADSPEDALTAAHTRYIDTIYEVADEEPFKPLGKVEAPVEGLPRITFGIPTVRQPGWLPEMAQRSFWLMEFSGDPTTRRGADRQLQELNIREYDGVASLPDVDEEPLAKRGTYSSMYIYRNFIFIPVYYTHNHDKTVVFRHIATRNR